MPNLLLIFLTGLTTGGLTCLALQGGLLASLLSTSSKPKTATTIFLVSKIIGHTILGLILGYLGTAFSFSPIFKGSLQIVLGIYLIGVGLSLLQAHPIFRYFVFTPPKKIAKLIHHQRVDLQYLSPAILGLLTIFLPCATTQAMELLALGTGNPIQSALILFAFTLGTTPTFLIFSLILQGASHKFHTLFNRLAATLIIFLGLFSINSGLSVMGSIYTAQNFIKAAISNNDFTISTKSDKFQEVTINISSYGYSPSNITLKKDVPVKLHLVTKNTYSCARSFTIPSLGISKLLPTSGQTTIEFTPTKLGQLTFSCSMGMYTGIFNVE